MSAPRTPVHYGWLIAATGTLCIFASLGLGRFALGMLLPAMGEGLNLSYSQMGLISTSNLIGYLIAVLVCGPLNEKIGARQLIFLSLFTAGLTLIAIGRARSFTTVLALYCLTGAGSGASNVPMMALISPWFASRLRGKAAGIIVIGSGFAILLSGKLVPYLNSLENMGGWRLSWMVVGAMVVAVALICLAVIRNRPEDVGLKPVGWEPSRTPENFQVPERVLKKGYILHLGAIYFLFGCTYVIYATFIVTALIKEKGFSESMAGSFWSTVGFLSLFSGPFFGSLSDRIGRKQTLAIVFAIQALAYGFMALTLPAPFLYASIFCYGIVAWSIPSIMAALVGDYAGPQKAARIFGLITFIFAIGQVLGPAAAGYIAETTGSFSSSFAAASVLALFAVFFSLSLRKQE